MIRFLIKNDQFNLLPRKYILICLLSVWRPFINAKLNPFTADRHPRTDEAKEIVSSQLLTDTFTMSFMQIMISKYLPLSVEDLSKWDEEPETFVSEEESDQWEFSLRVSFFFRIHQTSHQSIFHTSIYQLSAQKAVADLLHRDPDRLAPVIAQMLIQLSGNTTFLPTSLFLNLSLSTSMGLSRCIPIFRSIGHFIKRCRLLYRWALLVRPVSPCQIC